MPKVYNVRTGTCWPYVDDAEIRISHTGRSVDYSTPLDRGDDVDYDHAYRIMTKMNETMDGEGGWVMVMPHGKWWGTR